jgi:hypothetical protein
VESFLEDECFILDIFFLLAKAAFLAFNLIEALFFVAFNNGNNCYASIF